MQSAMAAAVVVLHTFCKPIVHVVPCCRAMRTAEQATSPAVAPAIHARAKLVAAGRLCSSSLLVRS